MDVGEDTTGCDSNTSEQLVEFLIIADCELDVTRNDTGFLVVTSSVSSELKNFGGEVLHDGSHVDGSTGSNTVGVTALAEETMDTTDGELKAGLAGTRLGSLFGSH